MAWYSASTASTTTVTGEVGSGDCGGAARAAEGVAKVSTSAAVAEARARCSGTEECSVLVVEEEKTDDDDDDGVEWIADGMTKARVLLARSSRMKEASVWSSLIMLE